jgi:hypothetical protein
MALKKVGDGHSCGVCFRHDRIEFGQQVIAITAEFQKFEAVSAQIHLEAQSQQRKASTGSSMSEVCCPNTLSAFNS